MNDRLKTKQALLLEISRLQKKLKKYKKRESREDTATKKVYQQAFQKPLRGKKTKKSRENIEQKVVSFLDVSDRKRIERELSEARTLLNAASEQIPVPLVLVSVPDSIIRSVNSAAMEVLGLSKNANYVGQTLDEFFRSEHIWKDIDNEGNQIPFDELPLVLALKGTTTMGKECLVVRQDGTKRWVLINAAPICNQAGGRIATFITLSDITNLKQVEEEKQKLASLHQTILDTVPIGLSFVKNRVIQWSNNAHLQIFGYKLGERIEIHTRDFCATQEDYDRMDQEGYAALSQGKVYSTEMRMKKRNGDEIWCHLVGKTINPKDLTQGEFWFVEDITERRNAEKKAQLDREQLLQADKMMSLGVLVSGVAHEINNPNNLVMFNGELLTQILKDIMPALDRLYVEEGKMIGGVPYGRTREQIANLLSGISMGAQRIRTIVDALREFARIDSGTMAQQININVVVKSALVILGNLIKKSTDAFSVIYEENIPAVRGNIQQVEQVIINLLTNACQALTQRTQAIWLRTTFDSERQRVLVIVTDDGKGISEEHMKRLFDPFFTTKREQGGTGLGLSVSYNIVKAHRGDILVQSQEGNGTTMTLALPAIIL